MGGMDCNKVTRYILLKNKVPSLRDVEAKASKLSSHDLQSKRSSVRVFFCLRGNYEPYEYRMGC